MRRPLLLACAILGILCVRPLDAALIEVVAGEHQLLPNTDTIIQIMVKGDVDAKVQGLFLAVQIGSGLTTEVPNIVDVDIISDDLLFGGNNQGDNGFGSGGGDPDYGGYWEANTSTDSGTVDADGGIVMLAKVKINTDGRAPGESFDLILYDDTISPSVLSSFAWDDQLYDITQHFVNGTIEIVPEPSSFLLMFAGVVGMGVLTVVRRKRSV